MSEKNNQENRSVEAPKENYLAKNIPEVSTEESKHPVLSLDNLRYLFNYRQFRTIVESGLLVTLNVPETEDGELTYNLVEPYFGMMIYQLNAADKGPALDFVTYLQYTEDYTCGALKIASRNYIRSNLSFKDLCAYFD